jgi:hypothetical protein
LWCNGCTGDCGSSRPGSTPGSGLLVFFESNSCEVPFWEAGKNPLSYFRYKKLYERFKYRGNVAISDQLDPFDDPSNFYDDKWRYGRPREQRSGTEQDFPAKGTPGKEGDNKDLPRSCLQHGRSRKPICHRAQRKGQQRILHQGLPHHKGFGGQMPLGHEGKRQDRDKAPLRA